MSPARKPPNLELDDIPLLEDVVEEPVKPPAKSAVGEPAAGQEPATAQPPATESIPLDILSEVLTERITALTDRLLRDASAEIHATLVDKVWEKLREEIPGLIEEALRENGGDN